MDWLATWYSKRIVNVNVNILLAGVLALGVTVIAMHAAETSGLVERLASLLGVNFKLIVGGLTFIVDLVADLAVYYFLHWYANHGPRRLQLRIDPAYAHLSFMQDATKVQLERLTLSPILYIIALGGQHLLLHADFSVGAATAIGFAAGLATTRTLHTFWMLAEMRRAKRFRTPWPRRCEHCALELTGFQGWDCPRCKTPINDAGAADAKARRPAAT